MVDVSFALSQRMAHPTPLLTQSLNMTNVATYSWAAIPAAGLNGAH